MVPGCARDGVDRQGAGVRRDDRGRVEEPVETADERLLDVEPLDHGLDDDIRAGGIVRVRTRRQPLEHDGPGVVEAGPVESLPDEAPAEAIGDPCSCALDGRVVDVDQADPVAVLQGELGDPGAHRPGTDHGDPGRQLSRP